MNIKGNWNTGETMVTKEKSELFPGLLEFRTGKAVKHLLSFSNLLGRTAEWDWLVYPPVRISAQLGEEPSLWIFCSAGELDFERRRTMLWAAVWYHYPCPRSWGLRKRDILLCLWKQRPLGCNVNFFHVWASFLFSSNKNEGRNSLFSKKTKSMSA